MTGRRAVRGALAATLAVLMGASTLGACVADAPVTPVADGYDAPGTLFVDRPFGKYVRVAIRFRVQQCGGVAVGSGFAIGPHTILTNRHVVAAANVIQAETWDGTPLKVTRARVSPDNDIGVVTVSETLTHLVKLAPSDPAGHTPIDAVGFPLAGQLHVSDGTVLEVLDDAQDDYGEPQVILTDAKIKPGNSGGPMFGAEGTAVGIVFARAIGTNYGIGIPISIVHQVLDEQDLRSNYTCANLPPGVLD